MKGIGRICLIAQFSKPAVVSTQCEFSLLSVPEISTEYVLMFMANVGLGRLEREGELYESCAFENPANELAEVTNVWVS